MTSLLRTILPKHVPAKQRLKATAKELVRLLDALPEPVCVALEKSGVVGSWRMQLESLHAMSAKVSSVGSAASSAVELAHLIRRMVVR